MPSPKLSEMLAEYRKARDGVGRNPGCESHRDLFAARAFQVCEYLLTLDASDLDERDRTFSRQILPTMDLPRRAEDIRARAGE